MSEGKENKSRSSKTQGWEEAGSEFYQERYNADCEVYLKKTTAITTLLPSKKNRTASTWRAQNIQRNTKTKQYIASTTIRRFHIQDNHLASLPDLSQGLSDEERNWKEILEIKCMPISMQQKKNIKDTLKNTTKLRLQGFNQIKWKHRKMCHELKMKWSKRMANLMLWNSSLRRIEGNFGTGAASYFFILKWLLYLNVSIFFLILFFLIIPNTFEDNKFTSWANTVKSENTTNEYNSFNSDRLYNTDNIYFLDVVQGTGFLKNSFMFYGAYSNKILGLNNNFQTLHQHNRTSESEFNNLFHYNLPLMYLLTIFLYFLVSLIAIIRTVSQVFKSRMIDGKWIFYKSCNLFFSSWDYCTHESKFANNMHAAIYNEMKYITNFDSIEIKHSFHSKEYMYKLTSIRVIVNIIVLVIFLLSTFGIYILINLSFHYETLFNGTEATAHSHLSINNNIQIKFENNTDEKSYYEINKIKYNQELKIFFEYIPYITIVCLNIFIPNIFNYMSRFERYTHSIMTKICLIRKMFFNLGSLAILLNCFDIILPHSNGPYILDKERVACWETYIGRQLYKLIIIHFFAHLFITFFINFPKAILVRHLKLKSCYFFNEQEFEVPKYILDISYIQLICWIGTFYCPLLPAIVSVCMFCLFYIQKFQCLMNSKPSLTLYRNSACNTLFMFIISFSHLFAFSIVAYSFIRFKPSTTCGPFKGQDSVLDIVESTFLNTPMFIQNFLIFFSTAKFVIPGFLMLILLVYYYYTVYKGKKHMVEVLKNHLILEGHDKQFLLNRLGELLNQQQVQPRK